MQQALVSPSVLRAVVIARQWLTKENKFASMIVEESVSNLQVLGVVSLVMGITMVCMFMASMVLACAGMGMLSFAVKVLKED